MIIPIGFVGWTSSGKDTIADILVEHNGYKKAAFADPLKALLLDVDPTYETLAETWNSVENTSPDEGRSFPWTPLEVLELAKANDMFLTRQKLQRLGQRIKELFGEEYWVDETLRKLGVDRQNVLSRNTLEDPKVIFTDVRFPREALAIFELGGDLVRISRDGTGPKLNSDGSRDVSERRCEDLFKACACEVENNFSPEHAARKVLGSMQYDRTTRLSTREERRAQVAVMVSGSHYSVEAVSNLWNAKGR